MGKKSVKKTAEAPEEKTLRQLKAKKVSQAAIDRHMKRKYPNYKKEK